MERTENCTFVKTLLMIAVVLYHSCVFWTGSWSIAEPAATSEGLELLAGYLNSFHIYGFTLVSGYLFCHLKQEKGRYDRFVPFVANKAKRLLVPYAATALLWVIPVRIVFHGLEPEVIFTRFILGTAPSQLWFLLMLFLVFVMAWPLSGIFAGRGRLGAGIVLGIYGIGIVGGTVFPNVFSLWTACKYLVFFWLGFRLRLKGTGEKLPALLWVLVHGAMFAASRYVSGLEGKGYTLVWLILDLLTHISGASMAFFLLQKLARRVPWRNSKGFRVLSQNAMVIYLLHQQLIYFVIVPLNGAVSPYLIALVSFVVSIAVSVLIGTFLRRYRIGRYLIGEKGQDPVRSDIPPRHSRLGTS